MSADPKISIVIPYRNWGGERLRLAVESHLNSSLRDSIEIVISDFGSDEASKAENYISHERVRNVYTDTAEPWSRGRALNAGIAASKGEYILAWDADIICGPELHEKLLEYFAAQPRAAYVFQCRDLSRQFGEAMLRQLFSDWEGYPQEILQRNSVWRPRWGMGIAAYGREIFDMIRGYDERFIVWGGEDRDLMQRFSRFGIPVRWLEDETAQIFHIYHESSSETAVTSKEGRMVVNQNHTLVKHDQTIFRNLSGAKYFKPLKPLVSVIVATYNRAKYIETTVNSVLRQTFIDFELIIVDDGSSDGTMDLLKRIDDSRLVLIFQNNQGVASARNTGIRRARGHYVVVHDDDDIMLPSRLSFHLAAITRNCGGSYGGWVDFDENTGQFVSVNPGKNFSEAAIAYAGKVLLHPTVMVARHIAESIPYDERYKGGSDFNWMMTIAANGAHLVHTGCIHILRRVHGGSLTAAGSGQKHVSRYSVRSINSTLDKESIEELRAEGRETETAECQREDKLEELYEFLPERLRRNVHRFSVILDKNKLQELLRHLAKATADSINVTSLARLARGDLSVRGLYEVRGIAEEAELLEKNIKPFSCLYRKWTGYAPRSVESLRRVDCARTPAFGGLFDFGAKIGLVRNASDYGLLAVLSDYLAVSDMQILLAVARKDRKNSMSVRKADRLLKKLSKGEEVRRLACLEAGDGVIPIYGINVSGDHKWLTRIGNLWSMRNVSLIAYQRRDRSIS